MKLIIVYMPVYVRLPFLITTAQANSSHSYPNILVKCLKPLIKYMQTGYIHLVKPNYDRN